MTETMERVECGACGWKGWRKTGNVVICPSCGSIAGFRIDRPLSQAIGNKESGDEV